MGDLFNQDATSQAALELDEIAHAIAEMKMAVVAVIAIWNKENYDKSDGEDYMARYYSSHIPTVGDFFLLADRVWQVKSRIFKPPSKESDHYLTVDVIIEECL